jgi:3-deoxy-D-manno-octulosonic-acid transferase
MYMLYSFLLGLAALLSLPWWLVQMARLGKYRAGFRERLGAVPERLQCASATGCVWIHAVSVGEVLAISQLVAELRNANPEREVFVSTTTATGQQLARQRFGADRVFYMPLDFRFALRPYFTALRPSLLVLAEAEFWPNLVHSAKKNGLAVAVVNARVSDRSFPRYRRFRRLFSGVLSEIDLFLAQTEEDARRLKEIGAPERRVAVSGNLKFDIRLSSSSTLAQELRNAISRDSHVLICGSTAEGEEELVLAAFREVLQQLPSTVMVLAPRHPERFDKVANLIVAEGLKLVRRSGWNSESERCVPAGTIFLLDSVGELASVYAIADVAFVGGSLVPLGGHNILEPAQHGVAVLTGPHTQNFREIVRIFEQGGGLRVASAENLGAIFIELLSNGQERNKLGQQARELFLKNTGATQRTLAALQPLLRSRAAEVK